MKPHFLMMARYNAWANLRLYKMAGALPEELYRREVGVYFKSLHGTLNHLLVTDRIWMRRLTGEGSHPNKLNAIAFDDFASLQAARTSEDLRIVNYTENLQEADMEKELDYTTLNGTPQKITHLRNTCALVQSSDTSPRPSARNLDSRWRHRARPA